ncbi:MAG: SigE family RNA polymerase sigma factor [Pseudonocardiales bacterium]|nr:MAG: SigE family RNA polymerase sigma factor [Pseudonocardiales bacterium]
MLTSRDGEFEAFVRSSRPALHRTTTIMCAGDVHLAEDVVQGALIRLYLAWPRARKMNVDAYLRRILVNALIDEKRRPSVRRETLRERLPERASPDQRRAALDPALMIGLRALPARMRAAVVLRHVEDLTVEETADALGCSTGTVKSQTSRGLDKLREQLETTSLTTRRSA